MSNLRLGHGLSTPLPTASVARRYGRAAPSAVDKSVDNPAPRESSSKFAAQTYRAKDQKMPKITHTNP